VKFGIGLPGVNPMSASRWDRDAITRGIVEVATAADRLGYEFVSAQDHPVIPEASRHMIGPRWYDALSTLSFVAGMTKRVRLLTSVVVLPYRDPFSIAKAMATLDVLSRGRAIFGVGVGHLKAEFDALGVPYAERGARTDEYLQIIKRLWAEESVTFKGRFYQCERMVLAPKPVQRPLPVWVGGNSRAAAQRAGALADGFNPFQVSADELAGLAKESRSLAARAGRERSFAIVAPVGPVLRNPDAAPKRSAEEVQRRVQAIAGDSEFYRKIASRNLSSDSLSTTEAVAGMVERAKAAGATHCNVGFRYRELPHYLEAMDWFAKEVMPQYA